MSLEILRTMQAVQQANLEAPLRGVHLPLTPVQWCHLCMNIGDEYSGGCCGTMGAVQDIVSDVFRSGGYIEAEQFQELAALCDSHDGDNSYFHEAWFEKDGKKLKTSPKALAHLRGWEVIALTWHYAKDLLRVKKPTPRINRRDPSTIDQACTALRDGMFKIAISHLFDRDTEKTPSAQQAANRALLLYRLWPALKYAHDKISELSMGDIEGFCIYDKKAKFPASNGGGLCVFATKGEAEALLKQWRDNRREGEDKDYDTRFKIRPVSVTMKRGIVYTDERK